MFPRTAPRRRAPRGIPSGRVLFGDLHVHTTLSFDAGSWARAQPPGGRLPLRPRRGDRPGTLRRPGPPLAPRAARAPAGLRRGHRPRGVLRRDGPSRKDPSSPAYESSTCIDQRETTLVSALDYGIALSSTNPLRPRFCRGMSEAMCMARSRTVGGGPARGERGQRHLVRVPLHHLRRVRVDGELARTVGTSTATSSSATRGWSRAPRATSRRPRPSASGARSRRSASTRATAATRW